MSAQSGISISPELAQDFAHAVSAVKNIRVIVVVIENGQQLSLIPYSMVNAQVRTE